MKEEVLKMKSRKTKRISVIVSMVLVISMMFSGSVWAKESRNSIRDRSDKISLDTIITKDNIYSVLNYLGLDSNNFAMSESPCVSTNLTVKDFQLMIVDAKKNAEPLPNLSASTFNKAIVNNQSNISTKSLTGSGSRYLYRTIDYGYNLTYSCSGQYKNGIWTGVSAGNVSLNEGLVLIGAKHKIDKVNNINCSVQSNKTTIIMSTSVIIGSYVTIGIGLFRISQSTVTATNYFYAKDY